MVSSDTSRCLVIHTPLKFNKSGPPCLASCFSNGEADCAKRGAESKCLMQERMIRTARTAGE